VRVFVSAELLLYLKGAVAQERDNLRLGNVCAHIIIYLLSRFSPLIGGDSLRLAQ
jgi:hypothetical protein